MRKICSNWLNACPPRAGEHIERGWGQDEPYQRLSPRYMDNNERPRYDFKTQLDNHLTAFTWLLVFLGCAVGMVAWGDDLHAWIQGLIPN